jgi:hypothetical protein
LQHQLLHPPATQTALLLLLLQVISGRLVKPQQQQLL